MICLFHFFTIQTSGLVHLTQAVVEQQLRAEATAKPHFTDLDNSATNHTCLGLFTITV